MALEIDYESHLPLALASIYDDEDSKSKASVELERYGKKSFHREIPRVRLGILYLASKSPERLSSFVDLACSDYRDLLCASEYPHSSRRFGLSDTDPEKYRSLKDKETKEYMAWIAELQKTKEP